VSTLDLACEGAVRRRVQGQRLTLPVDEWPQPPSRRRAGVDWRPAAGTDLIEILPDCVVYVGLSRSSQMGLEHDCSAGPVSIRLKLSK
jgi:hypothetical protein